MLDLVNSIFDDDADESAVDMDYGSAAITTTNSSSIRSSRPGGATPYSLTRTKSNIVVEDDEDTFNDNTSQQISQYSSFSSSFSSNNNNNNPEYRKSAKKYAKKHEEDSHALAKLITDPDHILFSPLKMISYIWCCLQIPTTESLKKIRRSRSGGVEGMSCCSKGVRSNDPWLGLFPQLLKE